MVYAAGPTLGKVYFFLILQSNVDLKFNRLELITLIKLRTTASTNTDDKILTARGIHVCLKICIKSSYGSENVIASPRIDRLVRIVV